MDTPSSEESRNYSDEEIREWYAMPQRMILGVDPATLPEDWEPDRGRIWVIPDEALEWGHLNREHVYAGHTMILPAEEREWRDNQHYRAYVRPTKEEDERAEA